LANSPELEVGRWKMGDREDIINSPELANSPKLEVGSWGSQDRARSQARSWELGDRSWGRYSKKQSKESLIF
jgi:hypothetical protein